MKKTFKDLKNSSVLLSHQKRSEKVLLDKQEIARLQSLNRIENEFFSRGYKLIAGVDEAGRGPLAGPVVAAACILNKGFVLKDLNDSKKLSSQKREMLYRALSNSSSVYIGIGVVEADEIDRINILQAAFRAMEKAVLNLPLMPEIALIDGHLLPKLKVEMKPVIGGDSLSVSIAAASVIAKKTRDDLMLQHHKNFPEYGFDSHKGYGTKKHMDAVQKLGPSPIHRLSFKPLKNLAC